VVRNRGATPPPSPKKVHHGPNPVDSLSSSRALEQGQAHRPEAPFKPKDIWALRVRLQQEHRSRELALVNLGLDSKLRACDLVSLKVRDITHGDRVAGRAIVQQKKTGRPVQFEITAPARDAVEAWIHEARLRGRGLPVPESDSRLAAHLHAPVRMLRVWLTEIGPDWRDYGTHSMRRTKATLIYRKTKSVRAVQLLLGHSKLDSTVRYLGIEVDDALEISEQVEI
jgi:integrase